jgi:hypothetical protein
VSGEEIAANYAALASLYGAWGRGKADCYALVADGAVQEMYSTLSDARRAVLALPAVTAHALVVVLQPLGGWRHPRFVVEAYWRPDSALPASSAPPDPLTRDFLLAERLSADTAPGDAPYLLIKDGAVLGRYRRVTQARQAVDAAQPPLAPVVFTSLRPGHAGPFTFLVLQALVEGALA